MNSPPEDVTLLVSAKNGRQRRVPGMLPFQAVSEAAGSEKSVNRKNKKSIDTQPADSPLRIEQFFELWPVGPELMCEGCSCVEHE